MGQVFVRASRRAKAHTRSSPGLRAVRKHNFKGFRSGRKERAREWILPRLHKSMAKDSYNWRVRNPRLSGRTKLLKKMLHVADNTYGTSVY